MQEQTILATLNDKVSNILEQYNSIKDENEKLRIEVITLRGEREIKNQEIEKLIEQNSMKDLEIEEIVEKIESIMS